ncbi:S8 family serine peptidase [Roseateles sp.]|uniref:S8 family serine peptidase n=1 Tax=Roseateles sp. TaxID=1971397 RepID=UPI003BAB1DA1
MANNPVQVVLQTDQYMKRPESGGGGGSKDFFEGRDVDFRKHKSKLLKEVESVRAALSGPQVGAVGFVKVKLQSAALAKSHRPMDAIFKPAQFPLVGTGNLGELYFEVSQDSLNHAERVINRAEETVTKRNSKDELAPSAARSEVGAIEAITIPAANEKRAFASDDAAAYFKAHPTGRYLAIELFVDESEVQGNDFRRGTLAALRRFRQQLSQAADGLKVWATGKEWKTVHITVVQFPKQIVESGVLRATIDRVLKFLDGSALVRRYSLGPVVTRTASGPSARIGKAPSFPAPQPGVDYPIVGVVDVGVTRKGPIADWCVGRLNFMNNPDEEREHGSFIAGLLVNGGAYNPGQPLEGAACKFFDFDLYTDDDTLFQANYESGLVDLMRQLDSQLANKPDGLRIVNMSLNSLELTDPSGYSYAAAILDELADKHDVIFVVSAGNLPTPHIRDRWPAEPVPALQQIATYPHLGADRVYVPGETARNLTVGALELVDAKGTTRPARYSRRGPATSAGVKPDFGHIGGCLAGGNPLISLDADGISTRAWHGTSFAAPSVAKTLALLGGAIEGHQPRELLLGLMYHFAKMPKVLSDSKLDGVAKDFAGFGLPAQHHEMLATDDHAITLLFADRLPPGMELSFDFSWPSSLVSEDFSRGEVALTVVCSPPMDRKFGAEFARANLDAYLRQETIDAEGEVKYKGRLSANHHGIAEKHLILHGAKWWPVKHYSRSFKRLEGTSNWRLVVDSLTRAGAPYPDEGISFAVVLTIADPKKAPIFAGMRQSLLNRGIQLRNVRTAARPRAR